MVNGVTYFVAPLIFFFKKNDIRFGITFFFIYLCKVNINNKAYEKEITINDDYAAIGSYGEYLGG